MPRDLDAEVAAITEKTFAPTPPQQKVAVMINEVVGTIDTDNHKHLDTLEESLRRLREILNRSSSQARKVLEAHVHTSQAIGGEISQVSKTIEALASAHARLLNGNGKHA